MEPERQERERVAAWKARFGALIFEALPDDAAKAQPETDALYVALLEMGIEALVSQLDRHDTLSLVTYVVNDISDAQATPAHWRNKEVEELAAGINDLAFQRDDVD